MAPPRPSPGKPCYPRQRPRHKSGLRVLVSGLFWAVLVPALVLAFHAQAERPVDWRAEFPRTDFSKRTLDFNEIRFDGARRDTIPPIDEAEFWPVAEIKNIGKLEPVLSIGINGDFRAYPLRILLWHEIVNDTVGGVPVLVSYCPLCNSGVVFDRRIEGRTLSFGNTGRLRHYDMVMYDRATESWWQQFTGTAIMGAMTGKRLKVLPARLESLERFRDRAPQGQVLLPPDARLRRYGTTPYIRMDTVKPLPGRFPYGLPEGVGPMARVVIVGGEAWTLRLLRQKKQIEVRDLILTWEPGQNSIHDTKWISFGRDIGNVTVQRKAGGGLVDVPYDVAFAFVFAAFMPKAKLHYK